MLVPAILYKDEIIHKFKEKYYSDELFYEVGCTVNSIPNIEEEPNFCERQYAIVDKNNKLLGYMSYYIDNCVNKASRFGIFSFDKGNYVVGKDIYNELEYLLNVRKLHKLEWMMIGGNPVEKSYDNFCKKHNGKKYILKDSLVDHYGNYRDRIIYEIFNKEK